MAPKFQKGPDLKRFMVIISTALEREGSRQQHRKSFSHIYTTLSFLSSFFRPQDKRLKVSLNGNRTLVGTLRGYDAFLNVVLEEVDSQEGQYLGQVVVRGNSIIQFEGLERVQAA
jgi:small nuclear ribonucleoprotein G